MRPAVDLQDVIVEVLDARVSRSKPDRGVVTFGFTATRQDGTVVLTLGVFLFFTRFLNVSLPAGWLAPLLGGAGI